MAKSKDNKKVEPAKEEVLETVVEKVEPAKEDAEKKDVPKYEMLAGQIGRILKEANESKIDVVDFSFSGGVYKLLGVAGEAEGFISMVQKPDSRIAVDEINELGGKILSLVHLPSGSVQFLVRYQEDLHAKRLKERQERIQAEKDAQEKAKIEAEQAEIDAKIAALKKQKAELK